MQLTIDTGSHNTDILLLCSTLESNEDTGSQGKDRQRGIHTLAMGSVSPYPDSLGPPLLSTARTPPKAVGDLNVKHVVLGDLLFKTWYPSLYPEELVSRDLERLYVCHGCFKYSKELMPFLAHVVRTSRVVLGSEFPVR